MSDIDHDMMTMEQARARIRALAAERDAAIDARLREEVEHAESLTERAHAVDKLAVALHERDAARARIEHLERARVTLRDERDDALAWHTVASGERDELRQAREREAYVLRRTAALLESTGYTTVERAAAEARRELAVVLGGASC
jgi:chromosome segregation ATPase